jgi:hypothetical protein
MRIAEWGRSRPERRNKRRRQGLGEPVGGRSCQDWSAQGNGTRPTSLVSRYAVETLRNILVVPCVLANMEKISKTELYQRGIPLLAFLPMLAFLNGATAESASDDGELASPNPAGLNPSGKDQCTGQTRPRSR